MIYSIWQGRVQNVWHSLKNISRHAKKLEYITYIMKKCQSTVTDLEVTQMTELVDKGNKTVILIIFQMLKKVQGRRNMLRKGVDDTEKVSN